MRDKNKWLWEYSKKLGGILAALFVCFIVYACIIMYIEHDLSALGQVADDVADVTKAFCIGYLGKAGLENVFKKNSLKFKRDNYKDISADEFMEDDNVCG